MPDSGDNVCSICHENESIQSVGKCDHHVCFKCATRMRVLMGHSYCPICRTELAKIVLVRKKVRFADASECAPSQLDNTLYGISFEDKLVQVAFEKLLMHCCSKCKDGQSKPFPNFAQLQDHVRKEHQQFYCDVCVEHLKLFTWERKCYTRTDLGQHRRKGDLDDTSHKGHPLCEFCDTRFLDNDELWRHLRKDHFFCHFCDADGKNLFFNAYIDVLVHFRHDHFVCDEGECASAQFTNVFRSEIDMRAHKALQHTRHLSKGEQRQARTLDVQFNYGPIRHRNAAGANAEYDGPASDDRRIGSSRGVLRSTAEEDEVAFVVSLSQQSSDAEQSRDQKPLQFNTEDFPDLVSDKPGPHGAAAARSRQLQQPSHRAGVGAGGSKAAAPIADSMARRFARSNNFTVVEGDGADGRPDDFPRLASAPSSASPLQPKKGAPPASAASKSTAASKVKNNAWSSVDQEFPALPGGFASVSPVVSASTAAVAAGWTKVPSKSTSKHGAPRQSKQPPPADDFPSLLTEDWELGALGPAAAGKWAAKGAAASSQHGSRLKERPSSATAAADGNAAPPASNKAAAVDGEQPKANGKKQKKKKKKKDEAAAAEATSAAGAAAAVQTAPKPVTADARRDGPEASRSAADASPAVRVESTQRSSPPASGARRVSADGSSSSSISSSAPVADRGSLAGGGSGRLCPLPVNSFPALPLKAAAAPPPPGFAEAQPAAVLRPPPGLAASVAASGAGGDSLPASAMPTSLADIANFISPPVVPPPGLTGLPLFGAPPPPGMLLPMSADFTPAVGFVLPPPPPPSSEPGMPSADSGAYGGGSAKPKLRSEGGGAVVRATRVGQSVAEGGLSFVNPPDFAARNANLSRKFKEIVEDCPGKLDTFRTLTMRFRNGLIDARSFYETCAALMGDAAFAIVFPELLVLLPDVAKQVELLRAHCAFVAETNGSGTALAALAVDELFLVCNVCSQVLARADVEEHIGHHRIAVSVAQLPPTGDDFPPLSGPVGNGHLLRSWVKQK